jgi:dolichol-phosphate mannosyltransferase
MLSEPRVRLVRREPPNGVGRALRDGFAAATGRYILTMDCDFAMLVPELRDLFDCIADGHDGAIGSRFSYESVLINYPFFKIVCNRAFHLLVKLALLAGVRDISNNLKLYRADILKTLDIEEPHFAANMETGLKPLLAGYDIREVPISWINRTTGMGVSSFRIARVAQGYFRGLMRTIWRVWRGRRDFSLPVAHLRPAAESVDAAR